MAALGTAAVLAISLLQAAPPAEGGFIVGAKIRFEALGNINVLYPERPFREGKAGKVTLLCYLADAETLKSCKELDENPKDWGFASAALQIVGLIRINPAEAMRADDVIVVGALFTSNGPYGAFNIALDLKRTQADVAGASR